MLDGVGVLTTLSAGSVLELQISWPRFAVEATAGLYSGCDISCRRIHSWKIRRRSVIFRSELWITEPQNARVTYKKPGLHQKRHVISTAYQVRETTQDTNSRFAKSDIPTKLSVGTFKYRCGYRIILSLFTKVPMLFFSPSDDKGLVRCRGRRLAGCAGSHCCVPVARQR